ncbi:hypothetical protein CLV59_11371 [Chitinophaga dinghuensis]|uniref:Membrane protein DUF2157 n=1 Tax=Chitinophaga dinghuensis TaxID=1539050 RepID=A0A327VK19_9BACT|nr:hypothetical protein [Chitinophaga dinghuensis]RAJ73518.1 hypothetical protein CLV59_11371 [Chitinophaga dinghuensis]
MPEVDNRDAHLLHKAIFEWQQQAVISEDQARQLKDSIKVRTSDWQTIALYIFIAAISCALMAFGSLVLDEKWIEIIRKKFSLTDGVIALLFGIVTVVLCYQGWRRKRHEYGFSFNRELYWLLPVLSTGVTVVYLGKSLDYLGGNYGAFWLMATIIYGVLALALESRLIWVATMIALIPAYVKLSYFLTGDNAFFFGMNLPCRMAVLGGIMVIAGTVMKNTRLYTPIKMLTYAGGWLLFLLSGWLISIFGNTGTWSEWQQVRQHQLLLWVFIFTAQCILTFLYSLRRKDPMIRDMAVVFFLLDLYTRYFEYLWDRTNKGLFFAILALSFWGLGRLIERRYVKK